MTGRRKLVFKILISMAVFILGFFALFFLWAADYSHADKAAVMAMESDETVTVGADYEGWLFDGPSEDSILIFYPGGKVEATAYAPLLHKLAERATDTYLVKMPLNLAFLGINRAAVDLWYRG